jgi:hypothetical protein
VDNLSIIDYKLIFGDFRVEDYTNIKKCTRTVNFWYKTHKEAATIITVGCHNWIWKPFCNDRTLGIRPRLDMKSLSINI